jgi:hypothetical protein
MGAEGENQPENLNSYPGDYEDTTRRGWGEQRERTQYNRKSREE